jgi:hypothetical protein
MKRLLPIVLIALVGGWTIAGTASADGKLREKCGHHPNWHWDKQRHRCVKNKTHQSGADTTSGSGTTSTELIARIVGYGGPVGPSAPSELSGEIVVYAADGQIVAERSTAQGEAVVQVAPGAYKLKASIGQSVPCEEREVTVKEKQQEPITLACTIN